MDEESVGPEIQRYTTRYDSMRLDTRFGCGRLWLQTNYLWLQMDVNGCAHRSLGHALGQHSYHRYHHRWDEHQIHLSRTRCDSHCYHQNYYVIFYEFFSHIKPHQNSESSEEQRRAEQSSEWEGEQQKCFCATESMETQLNWTQENSIQHCIPIDILRLWLTLVLEELALGQNPLQPSLASDHNNKTTVKAVFVAINFVLDANTKNLASEHIRRHCQRQWLALDSSLSPQSASILRLFNSSD